MNLRLRLIVAFFLLSVVPLGAVTLYTYTSNARALREAASHEAESLAGDLTQRMQLVTTQISERVERMMEVARASDTTPAPVSAAAKTAARASRQPAPVAPRRRPHQPPRRHRRPRRSSRSHATTPTSTVLPRRSAKC